LPNKDSDVIRYINCFRKRADISDEEFRNHWSSPEFNALIDRVVSLYGAEHYAKTLALKVQATREVIEARGIGEPYDAVLEYWWKDARHLQEMYETPEARQLFEEMGNYQVRFIDISRSTAFFTEGDG
jgi:quinol monooxygenase YgiN